MNNFKPLTEKTIHLASDHAGLEYKNLVLAWLKSENLIVVDEGAYDLNPLDDFPDFISRAAREVSKDPGNSIAIIFGGSGQGEAMVANRYPNVRATVFYGFSDEIIKLSREHNDANILSIGARFVSIEETKKIIWNWLNTPTSADAKYFRRNMKLENLEIN
jgi:ribose 5-phosphate isomerase B